MNLAIYKISSPIKWESSSLIHPWVHLLVRFSSATQLTDLSQSLSPNERESQFEREATHNGTNPVRFLLAFLFICPNFLRRINAVFVHELFYVLFLFSFYNSFLLSNIYNLVLALLKAKAWNFVLSSWLNVANCRCCF